MSDPRRDVRGNLAVLTPILAPSILALAFFGSAWARAGALGGVLAGSWMAGRRDPPPQGRLVYPGGIQPLKGEAARAYLARLRAQRRRLPLIGLVVVAVPALCAGAGALAGHPRYRPFTGGGTDPGKTSWVLQQAALATVSAWIGLLAGASAGWLGIAVAERLGGSPQDHA